MDCEPSSLKQGMKPNNHKVVTRSWMWSGSELVLVVVWIGSGTVWIRVWIGPEVGSHALCMVQLGWSMTRTATTRMCRQQVCSLAAWQAGLTTCNSVSLAVWQLGCATVAPWLLDCLTCLVAYLYDKCSLEAWQLGSVALQQIDGLAAWLGE